MKSSEKNIFNLTNATYKALLRKHTSLSHSSVFQPKIPYSSKKWLKKRFSYKGSSRILDNEALPPSIGNDFHFPKQIFSPFSLIIWKLNSRGVARSSFHPVFLAKPWRHTVRIRLARIYSFSHELDGDGESKN